MYRAHLYRASSMPQYLVLHICIIHTTLRTKLYVKEVVEKTFRKKIPKNRADNGNHVYAKYFVNEGRSRQEIDQESTMTGDDNLAIEDAFQVQQKYLKQHNNITPC